MLKNKSKVEKEPKRTDKKLAKILKSLDDASIEVGLPLGSGRYPDGTSVIDVGIVHEFGSPAKNIPERSFLRTTLNDNQKEYIKEAIKIHQAVMESRLPLLAGLGRLGLMIETDVKQKITDIKEPPLVVRKGGNPLVDTGLLRQSIIYRVKHDN